MLRISKEQMSLLRGKYESMFIHGLKEHLTRLKSSINKIRNHTEDISFPESCIQSMVNDAAEFGFARDLNLIVLVELQALFGLDTKQAEAQLILTNYELTQDEKIEKLACLVFQTTKPLG